jgi:hypothetical protein
VRYFGNICGNFISSIINENSIKNTIIPTIAIHVLDSFPLVVNVNTNANKIHNKYLTAILQYNNNSSGILGFIKPNLL